MSKSRENRLQIAIDYCEALPDSAKTNIKGKMYTQVVHRVVAFRKAYGDEGRITTKLHESTENRVLIEAFIHIYDGKTWHMIGNDWAEEFRNDGPINKKSATENGSTSAIGRALASCGLGGGEYASSEEVQYAINEKAEIGEKPSPVVEKTPPPKKVEPEKKAEPEEVAEKRDQKKDDAFVFTQGMIKMVDMMETHEALNAYWNDKTNAPQIASLEENYPNYFKTLKEVFVAQYETIENEKPTKEKADA